MVAKTLHQSQTILSPTSVSYLTVSSSLLSLVLLLPTVALMYVCRGEPGGHQAAHGRAVAQRHWGDPRLRGGG